MARRPKFKVGDRVRVSVARFVPQYGTVGFEFTITERNYRDDMIRVGPYWYRGGSSDFDPGIWEEYLEAVPASQDAGANDAS